MVFYRGLALLDYLTASTKIILFGLLLGLALFGLFVSFNQNYPSFMYLLSQLVDLRIIGYFTISSIISELFSVFHHYTRVFYYQNLYMMSIGLLNYFFRNSNYYYCQSHYMDFFDYCAIIIILVS